MKRKFLVLLIDGMADYPLTELNNQTPLEAAATPVMDRLAPESEMGLVKTIPEGYPPGSDVANLCLLGYNPAKYYTGRSPLEALSMGIELEPEDVSLRCNLVTLSPAGSYAERTMKDYSAGEISSEEAESLIQECQKKLGNREFEFYPGVSYRHVTVWQQGSKDINLTPPHDITDQHIGPYLPEGWESRKLLEMMKASTKFLACHTVNRKREQQQLRPANSIWFWGEGTRPQLPFFKEKFGLSGAMISAVDLIKGLGVAAGLKPITVPGATGRIDTDYTGKAKAAVEQFKSGNDFVYLHIEAADEESHHGNIKKKIKAIELVDEKVLKVIMENIVDFEEFSLMILADHYTPISLKTHSGEPVPFMIYKNYDSEENHGLEEKFSEKTASKTELYFAEGYKVIEHFLRG